VEKIVLKLLERGIWEKDYVVVTEVIWVATLGVFISNSENAKIELSLGGLSMGVRHEQGIGLRLIASERTPLYRVLGVRRRAWGLPIPFDYGLGRVQFKEF
jgi:hypothetical protein